MAKKKTYEKKSNNSKKNAPEETKRPDMAGMPQGMPGMM